MKRSMKILSAAAALCLAAGVAYADDIVEQAKKDLVIYVGPQNEWRGLTSSPKPLAGKKIAYISNDENNDSSRAWGVAIKEAGAKRIRFGCLVAAPEGVATFEAVHPDVPVFAAALDRCVDSRGFILPGLGDAGDRLFGTGIA